MKEINNIWHFFENMNEYVYVMDIETYEMIYMNRKTLEAYGLKSLDEITEPSASIFTTTRLR